MGHAFAGCLRIVFVLVNIICAVGGLALLGLSLYLYFAQSFHAATDQGHRLPLFLYILMGVGGTTSAISALGLTAGGCFSPCLLGLYAALMSILLFAEATGVVLLYAMRPRVEAFVKQGLMDLVVSHKAATNGGTSGGITTALDFVQLVFRCCGANGFVDFDLIRLPDSCCFGESIGPGTCNSVRVVIGKTPGCLTRFSSLVYERHAAIALCSFAGLAAVEAMLILMAAYLCHFVRRQTRY